MMIHCQGQKKFLLIFTLIIFSSISDNLDSEQEVAIGVDIKLMAEGHTE